MIDPKVSERAMKLLQAWEWALNVNGFTPTPKETLTIFLSALHQAKREVACQKP